MIVEAEVKGVGEAGFEGGGGKRFAPVHYGGGKGGGNGRKGKEGWV